MNKYYKCTYSSLKGAACPIMWKYKKSSPKHCHEYDTKIWGINPEITCKYCVELEVGEVPETKIWCYHMDQCDSYNDGGIEKCKDCPAAIIVFNPPKPKVNKMGIEHDLDVMKEAIRFLLKREKDKQEDLIREYHRNNFWETGDKKKSIENDLIPMIKDIDKMLKEL